MVFTRLRDVGSIRHGSIQTETPFNAISDLVFDRVDRALRINDFEPLWFIGCHLEESVPDTMMHIDIHTFIAGRLAAGRSTSKSLRVPFHDSKLTQLLEPALGALLLLLEPAPVQRVAQPRRRLAARNLRLELLPLEHRLELALLFELAVCVLALVLCPLPPLSSARDDRAADASAEARTSAFAHSERRHARPGRRVRRRGRST